MRLFFFEHELLNELNECRLIINAIGVAESHE